MAKPPKAPKEDIISALGLPPIPKAPPTKQPTMHKNAEPLLQKGRASVKAPAKAPKPKGFNQFPAGRKSAKHSIDNEEM